MRFFLSVVKINQNCINENRNAQSTMNSYRAAIKDNSYSLSEKFITPSSQSSIFSQLSQPSNFAQHQQNLSPSQPIYFTQSSPLETAENSLIQCF